MAVQGHYCSVCYEHCPVPGAVRFDDGIPMIIPETCTGCGICHEVCPTSPNAILVTTRRSPKETGSEGRGSEG